MWLCTDFQVKTQMPDFWCLTVILKQVFSGRSLVVCYWAVVWMFLTCPCVCLQKHPRLESERIVLISQGRRLDICEWRAMLKCCSWCTNIISLKLKLGLYEVIRTVFKIGQVLLKNDVQAKRLSDVMLCRLYRLVSNFPTCWRLFITEVRQSCIVCFYMITF